MKFQHFQKMVKEIFAREEHLFAFTEAEVKFVHPLVLAFVGDAYYHLFIRTRLLAYETKNVQLLNLYSAKFVSAVWQAKIYDKIFPYLTEEEVAIYRRARNAKTHTPRKASVKEYHMSTGFEALLGTLYLTKKYDRLSEIAQLAFQSAISMAQREMDEGMRGDRV